MLDIMVILALIGSTIAGLWDLKTTEVPDSIPIMMVVIGVAYWYFSWITGGPAFSFLISMLLGSAVLAAGLLMYHKKAWGEADAWILGAIAFMVPLVNNQIFFIDYIFNFLIVAIIYMVLYSIVLGIKNKGTFSLFTAGIRKRRYIVFPIVVAGIFAVYISDKFLFPVSLLIFLAFFWIYAKVIENNVFKRQIKSSQLRPGDVLLEDKWIGVTQEDITRIQKEKEFVTIKDGIRFVPVFAITLAVTLLWGNIFFALLF